MLTGANSAQTRRRVRITQNATGCSAHLINRGLTFASGGRATAEFAGVGPAISFQCTLNGDTLSNPCKLIAKHALRLHSIAHIPLTGTSPVQLSDLDSQYHRGYVLRVIPEGPSCTSVKKLRHDFVYSEPYSN